MATNFIVGNVSSVEGTRRTLSGNLELKFEVAVNTTRRGATGDHSDGRPQYYTVVAYGSLAENTALTFSRHEKNGVGVRLVIGARKRDRSTTLVADQIAPDLRWVTATLTKSGPNPEPTEARILEPLTAVA